MKDSDFGRAGPTTHDIDLETRPDFSRQLGSVTRRGFIAGTASTVALARSAHAQNAPVEFSIRENESEIDVVFRNERCTAPITFTIAKDYWSKCGGGEENCKPPEFRIAAGAARSMPDGSSRQIATIDIKDATLAGVSDSFHARFLFQRIDQDCQLALVTAGWPGKGMTRFKPVDFVDFMSGVTLRAELSSNETAGLAQQLFGSSIQPEKLAKKGELALGHELSWRLTGSFAVRAGLSSGAGPQFKFTGLRFAPTSRGASPFSKEILGLAFPDIINRADFRPGMVGFSDGTLTGPTTVELGKLGDIVISANRISPIAAAFLQFGDRSKTISGLTADFEVWVSQGKLQEGPFLTRGATIARYGYDGSAGFARLPIVAKPFLVSTAHGRFCIEAADAVIPQPGLDQLLPGIVLATDKGQLKHLEINALIRQAFVPFPADVSPASTDAKRSFFNRLDFAGGDCKFVLDPLAEQTPLFSSGSIIRLCATNETAAAIRLGLDQAVLRVVRPDDLLSLKFRFSGLALISSGGQARIVPLRTGPCGVHLASAVNEARRQGAPASSSFQPGAAVDDRPVMVVEFPPQHVAERAYFRQVNDGADPPDVNLSESATRDLGRWFEILKKYRAGGQIDLNQRVAARRAVLEAKITAERDAQPAQPAGAPPPATKLTFKDFSERFAQEINSDPLAGSWPDDQKLYIGSEWLDPDVRRFSRKLAAQMARERVAEGSGDKSLMDEAVREKLPTVKPSDPDFKDWVAAYDRWGERLFGGLPRYCGPESVQALVDTGQIDNAKLAMLLARITQEIEGVDGPEAFSRLEPTEARLSGPTRLAFRVNCDDFEGSGGSFPFTLADLTNWSRFDLSVVRRAEKLFDFDSSGRLPPHWTRKEVLDPAALLRHQGIQQARSWFPGLNNERVSVEQRMAHVYASANTPPQPLETAIELPFRLILSPAQDARWRTPVIAPAAGIPVPLWQATLDEDVAHSSLRAIWSEDFQPEVLRDGTQPAPHGVWAPWDIPEPQEDGGPPHSNRRFRAVMDAGDRHELVTLSSVYGLPVVGRRDQDGHLKADGDQIEPPPGYRLKGSDDTDAIYSPRAINVSELALSALGGSITLDTHFQPPAGVMIPGKDSRLFTLDIERWRHTAVLGRDISVEVVYKGFLFPLGNRVSFVKLTERRFMSHPDGGPMAYLIQRMFLRVGNPRKTFPALGQANLGRCFPPHLINILTKRTPDILDPNDHPSIKITEPLDKEKLFFHEYPKGTVTFSDDRKTPLPGLVFWPRISPSDSGNVRFEVQIDDTAGSVSLPMLFVDNIAAHDAKTVEAVCRYYNQVTPAKRTVYHSGTPRRYAIENKDGVSTFETISWQLMAEGGGDLTGATGPMQNKNFKMTAPLEGADQPPFYPYLKNCVIRLNQVGKFTGGPAPVATAEYFPNYLKKGFPDEANSSEVFLQTVAAKESLPTMAFGSSGDRAAGIGRPENRIVALSRNNGPIGGSDPLPPAENFAVRKAGLEPDKTSFDPSKFDPNSFFGQFGKILGIIDLGTVIRAVAGLSGMPQLSETIDYASTQAWDVVRSTVLVSLNDVLNTLDKAWASLNVGTAGPALEQIKRVFPDVGASEDALRNAVKAALDAVEPPIDRQAQLLGAIYEKARTFIQALQRMAADPLGPIAVSLQKQFTDLEGLLLKTIVDKRAEIEGDIDAISKDLSDRILDLLSRPETIRLLWAIDALLARKALQIDDQVRTNIVDTLATNIKEQFKSSSCDKLDQVFPLALKKTFDDEKFKDALKNRRAVEFLEDELTDMSLWHGSYFDYFNSQLCGLQASTNALVTKLKTAALNASAEAIDHLVSQVIETFDDISLLLDTSLAADVCSNTIESLSAIIKATRTDPNDTWFNALRSCIDQRDKCVSLLEEFRKAFPAPAQPIKSVAQRLVDALQALISAGSSLSGAEQNWANELIKSLEIPLDIIANELQSTQDERYPDQSEVKAACQGPQFDKLKQFAGDTLAQLARRQRLIAAIALFDTRLTDAFKSDRVPAAMTVATGKAIILAAIDLQSILVEQIVDTAVDPLVAALEKIVGADDALKDGLKKIGSKLDTARKEFDKKADATLLAKAIEDSKLIDATTPIEKYFAPSIAKITEKASAILVKAARIANDVASVTFPLLASVAVRLGALTGALHDGAKKAQEELANITSNPAVAAAIQPLSQQINPPLNDLFKSTDDATKALNSSDLRPPPPANLEQLSDAVSTARTELNNVVQALARTLRAVAAIGQVVLKGQIAKLIDINAPRREIENLIRDLIPHKATMAYKLDTELTPVGDFFAPDTTRGGGRLTIDTTAVVDLLSPDHTPKTTVRGVLDPINIHLFGSAFDVVTLKFKQANFGLTPGSSFKFAIDIEDVKLGQMVEFLEALQSYLTPADGNGFYLRPASGSPGIEVGYGLNLGTISLGPVSFINVSLNAGCRLPFDSSNALFTIGLSRPDSPFLISVGIYGGGGYLGLIANGKTIVGFEASFEFGGVSAFSFGPLTGIGMLTLGIFVRKLYDKTTIEGFFFCGGSARIACFGISASLMVSIAMEDGGAMTGQAIFTFSFSIGFAHIDFHITVFKTQGKLGGSAAAEPIEPPRTRYAQIGPEGAVPTAKPRSARARFQSTTMSPNRDWHQYRKYFAPEIKPRKKNYG